MQDSYQSCTFPRAGNRLFRTGVLICLTREASVRRGRMRTVRWTNDRLVITAKDRITTGGLETFTAFAGPSVQHFNADEGSHFADFLHAE